MCLSRPSLKRTRPGPELSTPKLAVAPARILHMAYWPISARAWPPPPFSRSSSHWNRIEAAARIPLSTQPRVCLLSERTNNVHCRGTHFPLGAGRQPAVRVTPAASLAERGHPTSPGNSHPASVRRARPPHRAPLCTRYIGWTAGTAAGRPRLSEGEPPVSPSRFLDRTDLLQVSL